MCCCCLALATALILAAAAAVPLGGPGTNGSDVLSQGTAGATTDVCRQGPMKGGALIECEAYSPMYTFNFERGVCEGFIYGGCGGSENLYDTRAACEQKCGHHARAAREVADEEVPPICSQPHEVGRCLALLPRFAFDKESGKCHEFMWGGCGGNENNFRTERACLSSCKPWLPRFDPDDQDHELDDAEESRAVAVEVN